MNRSQELRNYISKFMNIEGNRFKEEELEELASYCDSRLELDGKEETRQSRHPGWGSEGKYFRTETDVYRINGSEDSLSIEQSSSYHDDDGQDESWSNTIESGRKILEIMRAIFRD